MAVKSDIRIVEKPDSVSWDAVHQLLWEAHKTNREKGIVMRYPSLSGEEIRQRIEGQGRMFCALDGERLVGVAALVRKETRLWFDSNVAPYGYLCFAAVLPEYAGRGLYRALLAIRETASLEMGLDRLLFDTHEENRRVIAVNRENGFRPVDIRFYQDHYNVMMVKWLKGYPHSSLWLKCGYALRGILVRIKHRR